MTEHIPESMFPPGGDPYSVQQLAEHWRLTTARVNEMCRAPNGLKAYKIGSQWRIPRESVEEFLQRRRKARADSDASPETP